ncbi:luciferin 4-monooxygenase-like [Belonocnema kinseyi]|uniref:luciferin 4-monooxygenase-like n=1 Tax=Belonocnema kinseyi TaxID=2817044 RepID=UPI00143CE00D|nr:luciferin 4-monooxygenase-like [Belonocnema kinseyi]
MKRLGVSWIQNCYGLTEFTIGGLVSPRQGNKPGSVGRLYPGALCKIIDLQTSESLGTHMTGELGMKGDQVMLGYCDNPKATKSAIDQENWLHTGDLAYYDEDGKLYIVDRLKELIKYEAVQVAPAEIEGILLSHPEVRDAGVTGKPDEVSGEVPIAFIVRQPGSTISASEICQFVKVEVRYLPSDQCTLPLRRFRRLEN